MVLGYFLKDKSLGKVLGFLGTQNSKAPLELQINRKRVNQNLLNTLIIIYVYNKGTFLNSLVFLTNN